MKTVPTEKAQARRPRAVLYLRTATMEPNGETAIARQREACERKARELGAEVAGVYTDRGGSGRFRDRPGMRAMLADIGAHPDTTCVIVTSIDRLGRNAMDNVGVCTAFKRLGVRLVSVADGVLVHEASGEQERFMAIVRSTMGELYRQRRAR